MQLAADPAPCPAADPAGPVLLLRLAGCAQRELGRDLDKELQRSDWTGPLSQEQLAYAARDAEVLLPLFDSLTAKIGAAGLAEAAHLESRCRPAVSWLAQSGAPFDAAAWTLLAEEAKAEADRLTLELDAFAPKPGLFAGWNWDSPAQVKQALEAAGVTVEKTDDDALAAVSHPMAGLIRKYRAAAKLAGTYGAAWLKHASDGGRMYAGWRQLGCDSGRMSCSGPNLQNLPPDPRYRRCFKAPEGRVLVKADFGQIELRVAAKISEDVGMLGSYRDGEDLHTLTAKRVLRVVHVSKEQRQLAKALNFGLLYGMGAVGFKNYAAANYGVKLSLQEARSYRDGFFAAYPGLAQWHREVRDAHASETRTLTGRRRQFTPKMPDTERLNTPVQGTGADGLKLALALLWERREEVSGAFPVLAVHDEIVIECAADQAEAAGEWLRRAMVDAMTPLIDPVPVVVDVTAGQTWGG